MFVAFLRMDLSWACHSLDLSGLVSQGLSQWKRVLNLLSFTRSVSVHHLVLRTLGSCIAIFAQSTHSWKLALVQETRKIYPESLPSDRCHFHIHYNQTFLIRVQNEIEMAACK